MNFKSDILIELFKRGYIYQCTNFEVLDNILSSGKQITCYVGFDCTGKSLHVGSLLQIMLMRFLQKHGHNVIIIVGGGTAMIGDPSDKDSLRQMLRRDEIIENTLSIKTIFKQFLNFASEVDINTDTTNTCTDTYTNSSYISDNKDFRNKNIATGSAIILDNFDWLSEIKYIDFLREYGKNVSINRMLTFDSIKSRLERNSHLTFLEFNYPILQGYDFAYLNKKYGCIVEIGGSDQWSNILSGVDMCERVNNAEVFGLTTPLITNGNGTKMGKTVQGAIWLKSDMLTPYEYWQFWRNTTDQDVIKFLKLYTEIPLTEIEQFMDLKGQELNNAKILLANEVTRLAHGNSVLNEILNTVNKIFGLVNTGSFGDALPKYFLDIGKVKDGIHLYKLITISKIVNTGNEAKKLISGGGVKVNDICITNPLHLIVQDDFCNMDNDNKLNVLNETSNLECGKTINLQTENHYIDNNDNVIKITVGKKKNIIFALKST